MMNIYDLSPLMVSFFSLLSLILCIIYLTNIVLFIGKRRYVLSIVSFILLIPSYLMWQVIFDLLINKEADTISSLTLSFTSVSWVWWLFASALLLSAGTFLLVINIRQEKKNITPNSIKVCLDNIPCGICCYKDNGRVEFYNVLMNDISISLAGSQLLNGDIFASKLTEDITRIDDKVYRFSFRDIEIKKEKLHEIIAFDITNIYQKTELLEKDKIRLSKLNEELKAYNLAIDDIVRHKEILQTKINVHNEMNRLMLSTVAIDINDEEGIDKIFSEWQENALLLNKSNEEHDDFEELAKALNIKLIWENNLLDKLNKTEQELFHFAFNEALTNASKHASTTTMLISFKENADKIECYFTNDGDIPQKDISYSGGLSNLKRILENSGASLSHLVSDKFTLIVAFKKEN